MEEHRENVEQKSQQFCELILEKFKMDRQKLKNEKQRNKDLTATIDQLCAYVSEFSAKLPISSKLCRQIELLWRSTVRVLRRNWTI